ncbi:hypothetical protein FQR65_LT09278 [Abscondita terminalis]|nr:hypothetical protein FQR65_LT09278 [Abscondita terminalis]
MGKIFTKTNPSTRSRQNTKYDVRKSSECGDTENPSLRPEFPDLDHLMPSVSDETQAQAVKDLLTRLIPKHAHKFLVDVKRSLVEDGKDVFQLTRQKDGSVLITGSTGVSAATGFNHYLKYYCNGQVSWETANLNIPDELPPVNLTIVCQDRFRYYQNVCTGSYSFVWWSWADWEKHIDWMVLNSYNLVLSLNGLEGIWKRVYTKLNLTAEEINEHFTGPAFLAWGTMGNLRGWGGPLPESWISRSIVLQHQILKRMREFGVIPVLPAFAGHVPRAFKRLYPDSNLSSATRWLGFNDSYCCPLMVEPTDPLFETIGTMFMEELTDEFGTDHVYSCDSFNEMTPKNDSLSYLRDMGLSVYKGMTAYDPQAIWLMQGWLFVNEKWFWTEDRAEALLTSVPKGRMIILDLKSEQEPQYDRLKSYFGQPFIWCMLHNFGGTLGMYGSSVSVNTKVHSARTMRNSTMIGTGLTTEGINQNYVIYELMSESSWRSEPTNLEEWFDLYTVRRYGGNDSGAIKSWRILKDTLYNYNLPNQMHGKCVVTIRPSTQYRPRIWYKECDLVEAWDYLLQASNFQKNEGYRHDLVDVTRQILQV